MKPIDSDLKVIDNTAKFASMSVTDKMMYPAKLLELLKNSDEPISVMILHREKNMRKPELITEEE